MRAANFHALVNYIHLRSSTIRDRPNFGLGFGAECGQMGTFGGHSVSAESSRTTFGALSVSA